jgi:hypothetical protein
LNLQDFSNQDYYLPSFKIFTMGEAFVNSFHQQLTIYATIFLYGTMADDNLARKVAEEIANCWNEPQGTLHLQNTLYRVVFEIEGVYSKSITEEHIIANTNPHNNYFRVEEYSAMDISFVDDIHCNTGYFKVANLLNNSTTAAHEYGHTLGLPHPDNLDIRGEGQPGIMYPRGTLVDPAFQYDPAVPAGQKGGTLNPIFRKVLQKDIDGLGLHLLPFNQQGKAIIGGFSNVFHEMHEQP